MTDVNPYPPLHDKPVFSTSFGRLDMLWERYPRYHERTTFTTLEELLSEHESYRKDFEDVREEYVSGDYEKFLVQLSWADLAYRKATGELICGAGEPGEMRRSQLIAEGGMAVCAAVTGQTNPRRSGRSWRR